MGFMYGNLTHHVPRTNFNFYKVYPSRRMMQREVEEIAENEEEEVEIPLNEYLLVDYSCNKDIRYIDNLQLDLDTYGSGSYDYTVWQVQLIDNFSRAVAITRLHSILPTFETYGNYRIDILEPLGAPDYFGKGKNYQSLSAVDSMPIPNNNYMCKLTETVTPAVVQEAVLAQFPEAQTFYTNYGTEAFLFYVSGIDLITDSNDDNHEPDNITILNNLMKPYLKN